MIFTLIINIVYAIIYAITAIFRLAPDVSLPSGMTSSISTASGYISALDFFVPVHELLFIAFSVFFLYETTYFIYKLIMWVVRKIPMIS